MTCQLIQSQKNPKTVPGTQWLIPVPSGLAFWERSPSLYRGHGLSEAAVGIWQELHSKTWTGQESN